MKKIEIESLTTEGLSEIEVSYCKGYSRIKDYLDILVIKYSGKYGFGSAGNGVGDKCEEAIGTLIHGIDSKESATTIEWIFDNFEEAWRYVEEKMLSL